MAFIAPLKGVRYNPDRVGKIDDVVTPPYDVINENSVGSVHLENALLDDPSGYHEKSGTSGWQ